MVYVYLGKKRAPVYGKSEEDALEQARVLLSVQRQIGEGFAKGSVEEFIETVWRPSLELRNASKLKYRGQLNNHILPALGALKMNEATFEDLLSFKNGLSRKDKRKTPMSARTKRDIIARVKEIFELGTALRKVKLIDGHPLNPAQLLPLPKIKRKIKREDPEEDFTLKLLETVRSDPHDSWMEGPIFAGLFLGLRRGEVCGLKKTDIDRKKLTLRIHKQRHPAYIGDADTKGEERTLDITVEILEWLDRFCKHDSMYVFVQAEGKPVYPNEITQKAPALCEKAGLGRRTFHAFRSFAASNLIALGVDPVSVMEILGHSKFDTTLIYTNAQMKKKREGLAALLRSAQLEKKA